MTSDGFLSSQERLKFGPQRADPLTPMAASICSGLGLQEAPGTDCQLQNSSAVLHPLGRQEGQHFLVLAGTGGGMGFTLHHLKFIGTGGKSFASDGSWSAPR